MTTEQPESTATGEPQAVASGNASAEVFTPTEPAGGDAASAQPAQPAPSGRSAEAVELESQLAAAQQRLKDAETRATENLDRWQRAQADLSNFRRRTQFEREESEKYALASFISALLPVLDSFDRAWQTLPATLRRLTWLTGVAMIHSQLRGTLERVGVTEIDADGKPFDPNVHEAVDREGEDDGKPHVAVVLQAGYRLHERVLRPALVKVGPQPASASSAEEQAAAPGGQNAGEGAGDAATQSAPGDQDTPASANAGTT